MHFLRFALGRSCATELYKERSVCEVRHTYRVKLFAAMSLSFTLSAWIWLRPRGYEKNLPSSHSRGSDVLVHRRAGCLSTCGGKVADKRGFFAAL
jgi:hypothetical protein